MVPQGGGKRRGHGNGSGGRGDGHSQGSGTGAWTSSPKNLEQHARTKLSDPKCDRTALQGDEAQRTGCGLLNFNSGAEISRAISLPTRGNRIAILQLEFRSRKEIIFTI
jgi:hypothetical protein